MDLSIVIPTYNEKDNIEILINKLKCQFSENKISGEIIVVDDNSPDGTGKIVEKLKEKYSFVSCIHRKGKLGLSSAAIEGFNISKGNVIGLMDADLSHPPEKIVQMFKEIENGHDLVIGSRYINKGKIIGWNLKRKLMSRVATFLSIPFTKVRDPMTGFFLIKRECLDCSKLDAKGFKILLDILVRLKCKNIKEIPIIFVNRMKGKSKANIGEIFDYLKNLWVYSKLKYSNFIQFLKFGIVGISGLILNLLFLFIFTEFFGIYYLISAIFSFSISMTHNYFFNKIWTFGESFGGDVIKKYFKFVGISLFALVINLFVMFILVEKFSIWYIFSQMIAISFASIFNFVGNKLWTFNDSK